MNSDFRLGLVAGLKSEASALASASPWPVAVAGGSAERAEAMARGLAAAGATALISVGIAGALSPDLQPGMLVVADVVIDPEGLHMPVDAALVTALGLPANVRTVRGILAGSDTMVTSAAAKHELARRSGAIAVDMESHGVARAARALGLPFAVLRAIADPADRAVPPSAAVCMDAEGNTRPLAVMLALLKRPGDLPGLIALGRDAASATATLRRLAASLAG